MNIGPGGASGGLEKLGNGAHQPEQEPEEDKSEDEPEKDDQAEAPE